MLDGYSKRGLLCCFETTLGPWIVLCPKCRSIPYNSEVSGLGISGPQQLWGIHYYCLCHRLLGFLWYGCSWQGKRWWEKKREEGRKNIEKKQKKEEEKVHDSKSKFPCRALGAVGVVLHMFCECRVVQSALDASYWVAFVNGHTSLLKQRHHQA